MQHPLSTALPWRPWLRALFRLLGARLRPWAWPSPWRGRGFRPSLRAAAGASAFGLRPSAWRPSSRPSGRRSTTIFRIVCCWRWPGLAAIIVPAALLEHRDLVALRLGDDLGRDGQAVGRLQVGAFAGEQDVGRGRSCHRRRPPASRRRSCLRRRRDIACRPCARLRTLAFLFSINWPRTACLVRKAARGKRAAYGRGALLSTTARPSQGIKSDCDKRIRLTEVKACQPAETGISFLLRP